MGQARSDHSLPPLFPPRKRTRRRLVALGAVLAAAAVAGSLVTAPASAAPSAGRSDRPVGQRDRILTPGKPLAPAKRPAPAKPRQVAPPTWPAPGAADVNVPAARSKVAGLRAAAGRGVRAGALPVYLSAAPALGHAVQASTGSSTKMRVEVLPAGSSDAVGGRSRRPVVLRLQRQGTSGGATGARVTVDISGFREAFGGDWASYLTLVQLPECALTTPAAPRCRGAVLPSVNSGTSVTADVALPAAAATADSTRTGSVRPAAAGLLLAAEPQTKSGNGDYAATSLSPSATWTAGGSSGDFTWSYPFRVPEVPGGLKPTVELGYSAQSVDGRMAAANSQASVVGGGFSLSEAFIERKYVDCAEDAKKAGANNPATPKKFDLCWGRDNATLTMPGHASELLKEPGKDRWHTRDEDGTLVKLISRDTDGYVDEYWKVTTPDGINYWFGLRGSANSTLKVPVYGNHDKDRCHGANFAASACTQAYRWYLDRVEDPRGNRMQYSYAAPETNKYARNGSTTDLVTYDRATVLTKIEYGLRSDSQPATPAVVEFGYSDRCKSNCTVHDGATWPDTPFHLECKASPCLTGSPTFWTTKRLTSVKTSILGSEVELWTFDQDFGDSIPASRKALWLNKISHFGKPVPAGQTRSKVGDVTFTGYGMANRVDKTGDGADPMFWHRIQSITTETGATIGVTYADPECTPGNKPANPATNTLRCYPVKWTPPGFDDPVTDYFHKYVVKTIRAADVAGQGGSPATLTEYQYPAKASDGSPNKPAWHYSDDDGLITDDSKTWSVWRGYGEVITTSGEGQLTKTVTRYFRGMDGDRTKFDKDHPTDRAARNVVLSDWAGSAEDSDWRAGMVRESRTVDARSGAEVSSTISDPWQSAATATRTIDGDTVTARYTDTGATHTRTALDGGRGYRRTDTVVNKFDAFGMPEQVTDLGDAAVTNDQSCTKTEYARATSAGGTTDGSGKWMIAYPVRVQKWAIACTGTPASEDDIISDSRSYYDGKAFGVAPEQGNVTSTDQLKTWSATAPTYIQTSKSAYDAYGRVSRTWDPVNGFADDAKSTTTAYTAVTATTPATTTVTNPLGHQSITTLDPAWNLPTEVLDKNNNLSTTLRYDGLGRLTGVWLPDRPTTLSPSIEYSYQLNRDRPSVVGASKLNPIGGYTTSYTFYDGLLRARQTQTPSLSDQNVKIIGETWYDTAGRTQKVSPAYIVPGEPSTTLSGFVSDSKIDAQTVTEYDGAGRTSALVQLSQNKEKPGWRTTYSYGGDYTDTTPPDGGVRTREITDAQGHITERRRYRAAADAGYETLRYSYNRKGQLAAIADAAAGKPANTWTYTYDLLGRARTVADPDTGTKVLNYNDAGQLSSTTDSRNLTLAYTYDELNRRKSIKQGEEVRASWTYDNPKPSVHGTGKLASSTRYTKTGDGKPLKYTTAVEEYDTSGKPRLTSHTLEIDGKKQAYYYRSAYMADGSPGATRSPKAADLPEEILSYQYDQSRGIPTGLKTELSSYVTGISYTGYNELGSLTLALTPDGPSVQQTRNYETGSRRLSSVTASRSVAPTRLSDVTFSYDPAGNITSITDTAEPANADRQCFSYDDFRQLTEAWTPKTEGCDTSPTEDTTLGGPAPYWLTWTIDGNGNRQTQVDHHTVADIATTYQRPAAGQPHPHFTTSTTTKIGNADPRTNSYEPDTTGNTRKRPASGGTSGQDLTWDIEGKLETLTDNGKTTRYAYDADGSRFLRTDPDGTSTLYLPDLEVRLDTTGKATTATRYYSYAGSTIAMRNAGRVTWLLGDHQGTGDLSVSSGADQSYTRRRQTPYGGARGESATWPNDKGFVGGTNDPTGLTNIGARQYDTSAGQFISIDPIIDNADALQMQGYAYSINSPITNSDPTGLKQCGNESCTMFTTPTPDGEIVHEPGKKPTRIYSKRQRTAIGGSNNFCGPTGHFGRCSNSNLFCGPTGHFGPCSNSNLFSPFPYFAYRPPAVAPSPLPTPAQEEVRRTPVPECDDACGDRNWENYLASPERARNMQGMPCRSKCRGGFGAFPHSVGWCIAESAGAGLGVSGSLCVVLDAHGIGQVTTGAGGLVVGAGTSLTTGPLLSNASLEQQAGRGYYGNAGVDPGFALEGTIGVSEDRKFWNAYVGAGAGIGIRGTGMVGETTADRWISW